MDITSVLARMSIGWLLDTQFANSAIAFYRNAPENYFEIVKEARLKKQADSMIAEPTCGECEYENDIVDGFLKTELCGPIVKSRSSYAEFFGEPEIAIDDLRERLFDAESNSNVLAHEIYVDTPGGVADASLTFGKELQGLTKPMYVYNTGAVCSAGVALFAFARMYAPHDSITGNVGIILVLTNNQKELADQGIKTNIFASGDLKSLGHPDENGELPKLHKEYLQKHVDKTAASFYDLVSAGRPSISDANWEDIKRGGIYNGAEALSVGLIDGVMLPSEFAQYIRNDYRERQTMEIKSNAGGVAPAPTVPLATSATLPTLPTLIVPDIQPAAEVAPVATGATTPIAPVAPLASVAPVTPAPIAPAASTVVIASSQLSPGQLTAEQIALLTYAEQNKLDVNAIRNATQSVDAVRASLCKEIKGLAVLAGRPEPADKTLAKLDLDELGTLASDYEATARASGKLNNVRATFAVATETSASANPEAANSVVENVAAARSFLTGRRN